MERASSSRASSRNRVRGWYGLGSIRSMSICSGPAGVALKAGAAAAAEPPGAIECDGAGVPVLPADGATGVCCSGSRMSAPSPRPKAFLGIGNYLLCKLDVSFCALTVHIIENNRFTKARCFRKPHIAGNQALKDLSSKKTAQVGSHLPGKAGPLVVHRQKDAFNLEARIQCAPNAHQCVQEFRDTLQGKILALDRDQDSIGGNERVQGQQVECRRAIEDDKSVSFPQRLEEGLQLVFATFR